MNTWKYMPVLKWKRGEQDALRYLADDNWLHVTPLLEIQPNPKLSLVELRDEVKRQIEKSILDGGQVLVDTVYLGTSHANQLDLASWFAYTLQSRLPGRKIWPVVHAAFAGAFATASPKSKGRFQSLGKIILRFRTDLATPRELAASFSEVTQLGVSRVHTHIFIDQFSLVGGDANLAVTRLSPYLGTASSLRAASVTLGGGSFPINLVGFKAGVHDIPRTEWKIWKMLELLGETEGLRFSDYAVTNPSPLDEIDPTQVNPSISIRYAADGFWRLYKGSGFKGAAPGTLKGLCQLLTGDSVYGGSGFSYGDNKYDLLSKSSKTTNGVPWTWRRDATNRHLVQTVDALA